MKIFMRPRRCLLSWPGSRTLPRRCLPSWLGWQLYGNGGGVLADVGLAVAPQVSSARVLPGHRGRPRQGSCRGSRGFPRQGSCRGSRGSPRQGSRRGSSSSGPPLILYVYDLQKDLHATREVPPEPWFQRSWLGRNPWAQRVACSIGVGQVAPARLLPGPRRPSRHGSCRGSPPRPLDLCVSGLGVALIALCFGFPLLPCLVWPRARL